MQFVRGILSWKPSAYSNAIANLRGTALSSHSRFLNSRLLFGDSQSGGNESGSWGGKPKDEFAWDSVSSWSTGLTKDHFDGETVGHQVAPSGTSAGGDGDGGGSGIPKRDIYAELDEENKRNKEFANGWNAKLKETCVLMKQVTEPGARGSYLKDSEKAEMYRLHKENPEEYTIERLAKDYRIMRQRVHAILWLKELEEEEEKRLGRPLDDSIELLLDSFPEGLKITLKGVHYFTRTSFCMCKFFVSHDKEFHVASLPYKPDFKVMPEGWNGTTRDPDEVHYEISKKEDDMMYEEFVQKMNFNKLRMKGEVKVHKYSRRRPSNGWNFTVENMGTRGKRGGAGGWKFVSNPDGSTRPLNEMEKMYVRRETPRRRRRILP